MSYKVGSLDLPIVSRANSATTQIDKTIKRLDKLHGVMTNLSGFNMNTTGLDRFTASMQSLSNAIQTSVSQESIDKVTKLSRVMGKIQEIGTAGSSLANYSYITTFFKEIAVASTLVDTTTLDKISNLAVSLTSLSNFSKIVNKIDFQKAIVGFGNLATAIKPFLDLVNQSTASLTALNDVLKNVSSKKLQNLGGSGNGKGFGGTLKGLFNLGKWTAIIHSAKRIGNFLANLANIG